MKSITNNIEYETDMFLLKVAHTYDTEYEPIGLFSSMEEMDKGQTEYLKKKAADGLNPDSYRFVFEQYTVNELS